jgi:hypothetical protein
MTLIDQLFRRTEPLWFDGSEGREGTFEAVAVSGGQQIPVIGTRIARDGLAFVSHVEVRGNDVPVTFTIRRRRIPSRVRIVKDEPVRTAKQVVHRYVCSFTSIADDDRAAVVRYVDDVPEPAPAAAPAESGTLSPRVRGDIADQLVRLKRLSPPAPGMAPLIRLDGQQARRLEDGRSVMDVVVHSRLRSADGVRSFQTKFRVFADEHVEVLP